jgi:hypothetical protein
MGERSSQLGKHELRLHEKWKWKWKWKSLLWIEPGWIIFKEIILRVKRFIVLYHNIYLTWDNGQKVRRMVGLLSDP